MSLRLIQELQRHLIAAGLVRDPTDDGALPALPPLWLQPRGGPIGPGQGRPPGVHPEIAVSAFFAGGLPTSPYEGFLDAGRQVDLRIRTLRSPPAEDLALAIRRELDDRRGYLLGSLRIEESLLTRPLQLISSTPDLGYDLVTTFTFLVRVAEYA